MLRARLYQRLSQFYHLVFVALNTHSFYILYTILRIHPFDLFTLISSYISKESGRYFT
jgi:hypothetical protein